MARFPRRARLLKPPEFRNAFAKGKRIHERWFTAVYAANALDYPRVGLAIAKKTVPLAVQRNRIKRQIREQFRSSAELLPAVDIVILSKAGATQASSLELRANLQSLWKRISAYQAAALSS